MIGAATAVTVVVVAAKDGSWGPDQDPLVLMIGAAAGVGALDQRRRGCDAELG